MLKQLRLKLCITQKELSQKLGISESSISLYEKGLRRPKYETIEKMSKILKVSEQDLFNSFKKNKEE